MSDSSNFERSASAEEEHYDFESTLLINKYILIKEIGYGGYSSVWLAYSIHGRSFCAIKINHPDTEDSTELELGIGKLTTNFITSKSFISIPFDDFTINNKGLKHYCTVFPLYGGSMLNVIKSHPYTKGLPFMLALHFLKQVLTAMDIIHNKFNVIHTDIRPDNILISDLPREYLSYTARYLQEMRLYTEGKAITNYKIYESLNKKIVAKLNDSSITRSSVKSYSYSLTPASHCVLHDFGLVRDDDEDTDLISVADYRAPETYLRLPNGKGCDVWALGCTFFQMLTSKALFDEDRFEDDDIYSRDMHMLYEMFALAGYPPTNMIEQSPVKSTFFIQQRKKYTLIKDYENPMKRVSMEKLLEQHMPTKLSKRSMNLLLSIFNKLLHIDPKVRNKVNYKSIMNEIDAFLNSHKFYAPPTVP